MTQSPVRSLMVTSGGAAIVAVYRRCDRLEQRTRVVAYTSLPHIENDERLLIDIGQSISI